MRALSVLLLLLFLTSCSCPLYKAYRKVSCPWQYNYEEQQRCIKAKMFIKGYDEGRALQECKTEGFYGIKFYISF